MSQSVQGWREALVLLLGGDVVDVFDCDCVCHLLTTILSFSATSTLPATSLLHLQLSLAQLRSTLCSLAL